jgi:hypothetical protein
VARVRPVFIDDDLERAFSDRGYAVVDMLPPEEVAALLGLYEETLGTEQPGFSYSMRLGATDAKAKIRHAVSKAYTRHLAGMLHDHSVAVCGFVAKGATGESTIPGHLDWSLVDETRHRSVNVWIALCDTGRANGALAVFPGSQRLPLTRRGSGTPPPLAAPPEVLAEHLTVVPMRAGQAILYEPRLIHGSATNTSGQPRIAAGLSLAPAGLDLIHYVTEGGSMLREVQVDGDFFHAYAIDPSLGRDPALDALIEGRPFRTVPQTSPITTENVRALARGRSGTSALARLGRFRRRRRG